MAAPALHPTSRTKLPSHHLLISVLLCRLDHDLALVPEVIVDPYGLRTTIKRLTTLEPRHERQPREDGLQPNARVLVLAEKVQLGESASQLGPELDDGQLHCMVHLAFDPEDGGLHLGATGRPVVFAGKRGEVLDRAPDTAGDLPKAEVGIFDVQLEGFEAVLVVPAARADRASLYRKGESEVLLLDRSDGLRLQDRLPWPSCPCTPRRSPAQVGR